jgi:predicted nuclease of predicted toxin-antitoxin system
VARLLCDENLGRTVPRLLREAGHDVQALCENVERGASDQAVFDLAVTDDRILVTRDLDFSDIRRFPLGAHLGLVVLRYPSDAPAASLAEAVLRTLDRAGVEILGALLVVTPTLLRMRSPRPS